jgi:hypothetical protein
MKSRLRRQRSDINYWNPSVRRARNFQGCVKISIPKGKLGTLCRLELHCRKYAKNTPVLQRVGKKFEANQDDIPFPRL